MKYWHVQEKDKLILHCAGIANLRWKIFLYAIIIIVKKKNLLVVFNYLLKNLQLLDKRKC